MADIDYPLSLPGVLLASHSAQGKDLVRRNDLQSGPPVFRLQDFSGWVSFSVAWQYNAAQAQLFRNWFRWTLAEGSKLFNIDLPIENTNIVNGLTSYECYFNGRYSQSVSGTGWIFTAELLAIEEQTLSQEAGESLPVIYNGFENPQNAILLLDECVALIEQLWVP